MVQRVRGVIAPGKDEPVRMETILVPELPLLDVFGRGGALKSPWNGDCLPSRDFPMLVDLHPQRRLDPASFVTERLELDDGGIEKASARMHAGDVLRSVVMP